MFDITIITTSSIPFSFVVTFNNTKTCFLNEMNNSRLVLANLLFTKGRYIGFWTPGTFAWTLSPIKQQRFSGPIPPLTLPTQPPSPAPADNYARIVTFNLACTSRTDRSLIDRENAPQELWNARKWKKVLYMPRNGPTMLNMFISYVLGGKSRMLRRREEPI